MDGDHYWNKTTPTPQVEEIRKIVRVRGQGVCYEIVTSSNVRSCTHKVSAWLFKRGVNRAYIHGKTEEGKPKRLIPTQRTRQLRNADFRRNSLPRENILIGSPIQMVCPIIFVQVLCRLLISLFLGGHAGGISQLRQNKPLPNPSGITLVSFVFFQMFLVFCIYIYISLCK